MLRITTSHSAEAAKNYFDVALKTSDYYTKDMGTWGGKGAEMLELEGEWRGRISWRWLTIAHVIAEVGGDWDKWKAELGVRSRESKSSAKYKVRQELVTHWQSEMTPKEQESLRPEDFCPSDRCWVYKNSRLSTIAG